jgi:hypothetical protein
VSSSAAHVLATFVVLAHVVFVVFVVVGGSGGGTERI